MIVEWCMSVKALGVCAHSISLHRAGFVLDVIDIGRAELFKERTKIA